MSRQTEVLDSREGLHRLECFHLGEPSLRCLPWLRHSVVSLDDQRLDLQRNRHLLDQAFVFILYSLQNDVFSLEGKRLLEIRGKIEQSLKNYAKAGRVQFETGALPFLASQEGFVESLERMGAALDDYLGNAHEIVDSITIQASTDAELERTTLTVTLSLPTQEIDSVLRFRRQLCEYLGSVLSDDDKIRITTSVKRTA